MRKIALWEARHLKIVVTIALFLLIPSIICFFATQVNYDIMSYLPDTFDSVKGEQVLDKTFNNAAISIIVTEDMPSKYAAALKSEIEKVDGVASVMWFDDLYCYDRYQLRTAWHNG